MPPCGAVNNGAKVQLLPFLSIIKKGENVIRGVSMFLFF